MKKRRMSGILVIVMLVSMLLTAIPVTGAMADGTTITLGAGALTAGNKVYFGGVLWRVLSPGTDNTLPVSDKGEALLISNNTLASIKFNDSTSDGNAWSGSKAQKWCADYYKDWPAGIEKDAIRETSVTETGNYTYNSPHGENIVYGPASLDKEHFFFLSAEEAVTLFSGDDDRKTSGAELYWWLRSPFPSNSNYAGVVNRDGWVQCYYVDGYLGGDYTSARPAFNLNLNSVLFSSEISSESQTSYKLTLKDENLKIAVTQGESVTKSGTTVTVPYTITNDTANSVTANQVSVIVTTATWNSSTGWSSTAAPLQYAPLTVGSDGVGTGGTGTFKLDTTKVTGTWGTNYHVYLLAEEVHNSSDTIKLTDYASVPVELEYKEYPLWVGGTQVTSANASDIPNANGTKSGKASYDAANNTLTLTNYRYEGAGYEFEQFNYSTIYYTGSKELTISVNGTNVIKNNQTYGANIYSTNDSAGLIITGGGSLSVSGLEIGIFSEKSLAVENCRNLNVTGSNKGIFSQEQTTIENSEVTATGNKGYGIWTSNSGLTITGSSVTAMGGDRGLLVGAYGTGELSISGNSTVIANATGDDADASAIAARTVSSLEDVYISKPAGGEFANPSGFIFEVYAPNTATTAKEVTIQPKSEWKGGTAASGSAVYGKSGTVDLSDLIAQYAEPGDITVTDQDKVLDGTPTISGNTLSFTFKDDAALIGKTATASFSVGGNASACKTYQVTVTLTVDDKPAASVSAKPAANDLTYTGDDQALISAGATAEGTMKYALTTKKKEPDATAYTYDNDSLPTGKNAGTYYVWYKAAGDKDHKDSEAASVTVTIGKADAAAATVAPNNRTYDGTGKPLVTVTGKPTGGEMQYALGKDGKTAPEKGWSADIPTGTDAGTYYVWYQVAGDENHTDTEPACVTAEIAPAGVTLTADSDESLVYNGKKQTVSGYTADVKGLVFDKVSAEGSGTDAGEYEVAFTGVKLNETLDTTGNYVVTKTESGKLVISPKSIAGAEVKLSDKQLQYSGQEQKVTVASVKIDGLTLTADDYTVSGDTKGTDKGTYTVTVTGKGNYTDSETAQWRIVEKPMTVSAENVKAVYDGKAHGITVTVTDPESGYTVKYGKAEGTYDLDKSPEITDVKDSPLTVYYKVTADNYDEYTGSAKVTITKADQDAPAAPEAKEVTGDSITLKAVDGSEYRMGDGDWQESPKFTGLEPGKEYAFSRRLAGDDNHNPSPAGEEAKISTLKVISATVTFKVAHGAWNDGTKKDVTVTLTGYEGETLKLAADQIPAAGKKPGKKYYKGQWDVKPAAGTEITGDTVYTYTYTEKKAPTVTAPQARKLTENGKAQKLVKAGTVKGGTMQYALGKNKKSAPKKGWSEKIPTGTKKGTYYVWYKVAGDGKHLDTKAACVKVVIQKYVPKPEGRTRPRAKTVGDDGIELKWSKMKNIDGYDVFFVECSKTTCTEDNLVKTLKPDQTSITFSGLRPNKAYKMIVKAFVENKKDKTKTYYGDQYKLHIITGGHTHKETNAKGVKAEKEITVRVGKTKKLKYTLTPEAAGYEFLAHAGGPVYFTSTNPSVAAVDKYGEVKGLKPGKCEVEIRTHTGAYTRVTVIVPEPDQKKK